MQEACSFRHNWRASARMIRIQTNRSASWSPRSLPPLIIASPAFRLGPSGRANRLKIVRRAPWATSMPFRAQRIARRAAQSDAPNDETITSANKSLERPPVSINRARRGRAFVSPTPSGAAAKYDSRTSAASFKQTDSFVAAPERAEFYDTPRLTL